VEKLKMYAIGVACVSVSNFIIAAIIANFFHSGNVSGIARLIFIAEALSLLPTRYQ